jgi:hypothetical protein
MGNFVASANSVFKVIIALHDTRRGDISPSLGGELSYIFVGWQAKSDGVAYPGKTLDLQRVRRLLGPLCKQPHESLSPDRALPVTRLTQIDNVLPATVRVPLPISAATVPILMVRKRIASIASLAIIGLLHPAVRVLVVLGIPLCLTCTGGTRLATIAPGQASKTASRYGGGGLRIHALCETRRGLIVAPLPVAAGRRRVKRRPRDSVLVLHRSILRHLPS